MTEGIVKPPSGPSIPEKVVLAATQPDFAALVKNLDAEEVKAAPMPMKLYRTLETAIAGPFMGSPQAAMLLENLVAWGGKRFLFTGWCGSVTGSISIGETLLVTGAFVDEGTSLHYGVDSRGRNVAPGEELTQVVRSTLGGAPIEFAEGKVWTTDGFYRETSEKIRRFRDLGAIGVEMECSALFAVSRFLKVSMAALVTVSDDVSGLAWNKGFGTPAFKEGRKRTLDAVKLLVRTPAW